MAPAAAQRVGVPDAASVEKHSKIAKELANYYSGLLGEHVHMLYPTITSGSSHSKVMAIEYPDGKGSTFLLVVITSANAMDGDMRYSDNVSHFSAVFSSLHEHGVECMGPCERRS